MKGFVKVGMIAGSLAITAASYAQFVTLTDAGSSVRFGTTGEQAGAALDWRIGQSDDQLSAQSYHFRVAGDDFERYVGEIGTPIVTQSLPNLVEFKWNTNTWEISIRYFLTGGVGTSDLAEVVRITNRGSSALNMSLFEYDDFDLNGDASGDTVEFENSSTAFQTDGLWNVRVGATPIPTLKELGGFPDTLLSLTDQSVTNLGNNLTTFTGDATFAYQWDISVGGGQSWLMSKNKILTNVVPEPGTMAALALGAGALIARRRKNKS